MGWRTSFLKVTVARAATTERRISPQDLGIWSDQHAEALAPIATFIHSQGAVAGIQLAHAGRKASTLRPWEGNGAVAAGQGGWQPVAPSALACSDKYPQPRELARDEIAALPGQFAAAARRSLGAGFQLIEIHAAHGYLLHEFMSPLANLRRDEYGGSFENRVRLTLEVVRAVRAVVPATLPLFVRISATDWVASGWDLAQSVRLAKLLKEAGVNFIDCSSGGLSAQQKIAAVPGFQVPFAKSIRREAGVATGAVGLITDAAEADAIIAEGKADAVLLARAFLRDPYWTRHAALELGAKSDWPAQYGRA